MVERLQRPAVSAWPSIGRAENNWFSVSAPWKISPPRRPNSRSRSSGDSIWRPMTLAAKPGAYWSTRRVHESAAASSVVVPRPPSAIPARRAGRRGWRHARRPGTAYRQGRGNENLDHRLAAAAVHASCQAPSMWPRLGAMMMPADR